MAKEKAATPTEGMADPSAPVDKGELEATPAGEVPEQGEQAAPTPAEELASVKDQLLRLAADFDNYRKRARREKEEFQKIATERLLRDILPVGDNLDRALSHAPANDPVATGVRMVSKQLLDVLASYGVRPFDSLGKAFDPEQHEALSQAPAGDAQPGSVLEEIERGYMLHDRLLRPAKVVVAVAPESAAEGEGVEGES